MRISDLSSYVGSSDLPFHDALADGRDLIIPDHPGFGGTDDFSSLKTIDDLVYHYLDLLDALGLDRVDLIGASFGGWIAAELAVHSPERFPHLVLLGPAGLRSEEHTSELQSLMRISYAVFCLKKKKTYINP